jgi:hypothetical protein
MVCDNIISYEVALANGTVVDATSTQHSDLWRALKGGTGNFGIVTRITAKAFPSGKIWSGYAFFAPWQERKILTAFSEFNRPENFDKYASGTIVALAYAQSVGVRLIASNLAYTKPEKWPPVFKKFNSIWRVWSTHKVHSLLDATDELNRMSPSGLRQFQASHLEFFVVLPRCNEFERREPPLTYTR